VEPRFCEIQSGGERHGRADYSDRCVQQGFLSAPGETGAGQKEAGLRNFQLAAPHRVDDLASLLLRPGHFRTPCVAEVRSELALCANSPAGRPLYSGDSNPADELCLPEWDTKEISGADRSCARRKRWRDVVRSVSCQIPRGPW